MARSREISAGIAIFAAVLWFMPWRAVDIGFLPREMIADFGTDLYQSGQHIGGLAWLVLAAAIGFGIAGWMRQHLLAAMLATAGTLICILFVLEAGDGLKWGLPVLTLVLACAGAWQGRIHARTPRG